MSVRRKPDQARQIADLQSQVAELQRQAGALTTLALDQQGRIKALSVVNAFLVALATEQGGASAPMLQAVRGLFGVFGAGLAAMPGTAPAVAAASAMQVEEVLRLAETWVASHGAATHAQGTAGNIPPETAEPDTAKVIRMPGAAAAQGREKT